MRPLTSSVIGQRYLHLGHALQDFSWEPRIVSNVPCFCLQPGKLPYLHIILMSSLINFFRFLSIENLTAFSRFFYENLNKQILQLALNFVNLPSVSFWWYTGQSLQNNAEHPGHSMTCVGNLWHILHLRISKYTRMMLCLSLTPTILSIGMADSPYGSFCSCSLQKIVLTSTFYFLITLSRHIWFLSLIILHFEQMLLCSGTLRIMEPLFSSCICSGGLNESRIICYI